MIRLNFHFVSDIMPAMGLLDGAKFIFLFLTTGPNMIVWKRNKTDDLTIIKTDTLTNIFSSNCL